MIKTKTILAFVLCLATSYSYANNNHTGPFVSISPYVFPTLSRNISGNNTSNSQNGRLDSVPVTFKAGYKFKNFRLFGSHIENVSSGVVSDVDFSIFGVDYVSDGGFIVGLGAGVGAYREKPSAISISNSGNTVTHFNIGFAELNKGLQWSIMYSGSSFAFTHQFVSSGITTPINATIGFSGITFEIGYGF